MKFIIEKSKALRNDVDSWCHKNIIRLTSGVSRFEESNKQEELNSGILRKRHK
jgi:hypothetical protein